MNEALLRSVIRSLIAEGDDGGPRYSGPNSTIKWAIDVMGEKLRNDRATIVGKLRRKLRDRGALRFEPTPADLEPPADPTIDYHRSPDWIDFRDRIAGAVFELGLSTYNDMWGLVQWAAGLKRVPAPAPAAGEPAGPPPAPEGSPFERWAFSPQRGGDVPRERNTALENRIIGALRSHFIRNIPLPAELGRLMIDLVDRGLYTDILRKPERGTLLYRGIDAGDDFIRSLGLDPEADVEGEHDLRIRVDAGRKGRCSSWTTDPSIASLFAGSGDFSRGGRWAVVLVARAGDNPGAFLDGESFLNGLTTFAGEDRPVRDESECIGVGSILLSGVEISLRI